MNIGDRIMNKLTGDVATIIRWRYSLTGGERRAVLRMHESGERVDVFEHDLHGAWRAHPKKEVQNVSHS